MEIDKVGTHYTIAVAIGILFKGSAYTHNSDGAKPRNECIGILVPLADEIPIDKAEHSMEKLAS